MKKMRHVAEGGSGLRAGGHLSTTLGLLLSLPGAVCAQQFELESAVIDSATQQVVGAGKESGGLAGFLDSQKKIVLGILKDIGIDVGNLPPAVRDSLLKPHTSNFEAFQLFSKGLDAQDAGNFAEAKSLFEQAVALDPGFALAELFGAAMPNFNAGDAEQRAAALKGALDKAVNEARQEADPGAGEQGPGRSEVANEDGDSDDTQQPAEVVQSAGPGSEFSSNPAGASSQYGSTSGSSGEFIVAFSYQYDNGDGYGGLLSSESLHQLDSSGFTTDNNGLTSLTSESGVTFTRGTATGTVLGTATLGDGSGVSWGSWSSSGAQTPTIDTGEGVFTRVSIPALSDTQYFMIGSATSEMPTSGSATFTSSGGLLGSLTGSISVDFLNRDVNVNNLSFDRGGYAFSNLSGTATYASDSASGAFSGGYASGSCTGCPQFDLGSSHFSGHFLGSGASGLLYSTTLQTDSNASVGGMHVFTRDSQVLIDNGL